MLSRAHRLQSLMVSRLLDDGSILCSKSSMEFCIERYVHICAHIKRLEQSTPNNYVQCHLVRAAYFQISLHACTFGLVCTYTNAFSIILYFSMGCVLYQGFFYIGSRGESSPPPTLPWLSSPPPSKFVCCTYIYYMHQQQQHTSVSV